MSRVSYVMMNEDGLDWSLARDTVGKLIAELVEGAACSLSDIRNSVRRQSDNASCPRI